MSNNKTNMTVVVISAVCALGIGVAIGSSLGGKGFFGDKSKPVAGVVDKDLPNKTDEELRHKLSEFMLPENEFGKLETAILQAGMGLFMAQAQQAGIAIDDAGREKLKTKLGEKYSRDYFAKLNADSMKEMNKDDLLSVIGFYSTDSGKKFLEMSPKIIQTTMTTVQQDLGVYLPKAVEELVVELKGGKIEKKEEDHANPEKKDGEKS